jgi:hypothetical protein
MTERQSRAVAVAATAAPWVLYVVGLSTFGASLYLIITEPSTDKGHLWKHGGLMAVSLLALPGVFRYMASQAKAGVEVYRAWKAK